MLREHFDQVADQWNEHYVRLMPSELDRMVRERKQIALRFLRRFLEPGAEVLDVGCGPGAVAVEAAVAGYRVRGIDLSPRMVEWAEANRKACGLPDERCSFRVEDLFERSQAKASADAVLALSFLEFQTNPAKALAQLARILRPGGILVLSVPNTVGVDKLVGLARFKQLMEMRFTGRPSDWLSLHCFTPERIQRFLGMGGFIMMDYERHGFCGPGGVERVLSRVAAGPVTRLANDIVTVSRTYRQADLEP